MVAPPAKPLDTNINISNEESKKETEGKPPKRELVAFDNQNTIAILVISGFPTLDIDMFGGRMRYHFERTKELDEIVRKFRLEGGKAFKPDNMQDVFDFYQGWRNNFSILKRDP